MKKIFLTFLFFAAFTTGAWAQGYIIFANSAANITKISTNSVSGGAATGFTAGASGQYIYALFVSTTATSVNGQTAAISGSANNYYAFNDPNWTLVGYGTNTATAGRLLGLNSSAVGVVVPGVLGGANARFVVIGWSASIGSTIAAVQNWYGGGYPFSDGWIGQSAVSGLLTVGDGGSIPSPNLFGGVTPFLQGFVLGRVAAALYPPP